ncbi:zinc finger BED domain-containing protein RICESLEEPER 2-like [Ipomoea triloba]|uniref:zinc finger BED domain-containing protein RICESLEEPER 2-like n=1 Tax=Ipomoea triloba TaxID=35885 RepID=UPI00125E1036|nr:zinc finger BED domain-containing protein RICESLEEPER 2-like [Ipomoea triloba]
MESISLSGQPPPILSSEELTGVEAEAVERNQSQQQNVPPPQSVPSKKRKEVETRSPPVVSPSPETGVNVGVLTTWVFNQDAIRRALAEMILIDELPFRFVEGQGFRKFILVACPRFKIPSRWTISRDIYQIFSDERVNLNKLFRTSCQRVSITTDTWTSVKRINYMCITAHFIDNQWKLHKKIISFVPVTSHRGEYIAKALETCLLEWGLKNIFTVTVDNASSNDTAMGFFKKKLLSWGVSSVKCNYVHMRCIAHVLNLIVQDGLKDVYSSVKKVRDAVRYVRNSLARLKKFRDLADLIGVEAKSSLTLDVPTRWNSTYLMLKNAVTYQKVFEAYEENDSSFSTDLGESVLDFMDWYSVEHMVKLLKCFYEMTLRISGSLYVTANNFFSEISDLSCMLSEMVEAESASVNLMGLNMKTKFEKYWGDPDKMNAIIFYANILDPRDKIAYMPYQFTQLYGDDKGESCFKNVLTGLKNLFDDYVHGSSVSVDSATAVTGTSQSHSQSVTIGRPQSKLKSQLKKQRAEIGELGGKKTELEIYLSEEIVEDENPDFDILNWWKINTSRFPILSQLARDVLVVPISTVASESAFSTSGRVLDAFRSLLTPRIVEALVCAQDWMRLPNRPISVEENLDEVERLETELVSGSGAGSSEVGLSLPTIVVLETWTVANWQNGKWLGNYYLLLPFCNLPVWTVGTWNYEARTNG